MIARRLFPPVQGRIVTDSPPRATGQRASSAARRTLALLLACLGATIPAPFAGELPQTELSNGHLRVKLYLPDARHGFYRGTRFDASGMVGSLEYGGHNYYGPWFDRVDPQVQDFIYLGSEIVAGPCSAATGPAEEFQTRGSALGWDEAKPGGTFVKIGVGVLRKDQADYSFARLYEVVDAGKWSWNLSTPKASAEFTHELADPSTGYAYVYRKTVRLTPGKPEMVLTHTLRNTGRRTIETSVYNHNFLVLDRQPPGPDFTIALPYVIQSQRPPDAALAALRGNQLMYVKALAGADRVQTGLQGFGTEAKDYEIRIENRRVGAGMRITGDRPLSNNAFWSIRTVLAVEPFIAMTIEPGKEFSWKTTYEYYTVPKLKP